MATTLKVSPLVLQSVDRVIKSNDAPESLKKELISHRNDSVSRKSVNLPYYVVKELYEFIQSSAENSDEKLYFHEFLEGCEICFQSPKDPERNPELVARLERLQKEQENEKYNEMTSNVQQQLAGKSAISGIGKEVRSVQKQLMGILNFILTLVGSFTFGYMAAYYAGQSIPARVVIGLILTLITAAADLYFIIKTEV